MSQGNSNYPYPPFEKQSQPEPGLDKELMPRPDCGEESYQGHHRLAGRKAIITGGDSGIGRAVAIAFAREGADVVINYLPEEEPDAKEVIALIEQAGRRALGIPGDLRDEAFCKALIEKGTQFLGSLDILVSNAGKQIYVESIADLTTEQFDATYKTNIYATFWLCKYGIEKMKPGACIINTTSVEGEKPSKLLLDYASTKAAITNFTKGLAKQVTPKGIRVNAVAPGPYWSVLQVTDGQPQDKIEQFGKSTPMGRPGQPVEIAPLYVTLASKECSYASGQIWCSDGGTGTL